MEPLFHLRSKSYYSLTADNRLHLWDCDSRKERRSYVEKNHLAHQYTCSALCPGNKDELGLYAVGCSDGTIFIWDLVRGIVQRTITLTDTSHPANDIAFTNDGKELLIVNNQNQMFIYNVATGDLSKSIKTDKKGSTKIAVNPKANVVAIANTTIRIIDLDSSNKKKLDVSLPGGANTLVFSSCGKYLICTSNNSREVLLFDIQEGAALTPKCAAVVEGFPKYISCKSVKSKQCIDVSCVFETEGGAILRIPLNQSATEPVFVAKINSNLPILQAIVGSHNSSAGSGVTITVGTPIQPYFHNAIIDDNDGKLVSSVEINIEQPKQDATASTAAKSSQPADNNEKMLGALDNGGMKRPIVDDESASNKRTKTVDMEVDMASAELTLEQKLVEMSAQFDKLERQNGNKYSDITNITKNAAPTSDSLVTLIEQALQSNDNSLLEQCLMTQDDVIIYETCKRLPTNRIVTLLRKLIGKFEKSPARGILLTKWLSALLRYHMSYLVSVPDLTKQLGGLSQMLENRLSSYHRLSSLSGRLDLLIGQISSTHTNINDENVARKPKQIIMED